jgi:uncharacterized repeat protein (TIGR01451 family)
MWLLGALAALAAACSKEPPPAPFASRAQALATVLYSEGFESGLDGWTVVNVGSGPASWRVLSHPEGLSVSPALNPRCVTLPDSGAHLPAAGGTHVLWFGEESTGTYLGSDFLTQALKTGGTSREPQSGTVTSPIISLAGAARATLEFDSWWEIEGVATASYDMMTVEVSSDGGASYTALGELNPTYATGAPRDSGYTAGGSSAAPRWLHYSFDLSGYAGLEVSVRFSFATRDTQYNAFRGWTIDDVTVRGGASLPAPAMTSVTPAIATANDLVAVDGSGFQQGASFFLGDTQLTSAQIVQFGIGHVLFKTPALTVGEYDVKVVNPDGQEFTLPLAFTYTTAPSPIVTSVSPSSGRPGVAQPVTVNGGGFAPGAAVAVGGVVATTVAFVSATKLTATFPALPAGNHNVTVANPSGQAGTKFTAYAVTDRSTLALAAPNGGEIWQAGTTHSVTWTSTGTDTVRLDLYKGGVLAGTIAPSVPASPASYAWAIPAETAPGTDYQVKVSNPLGTTSDLGNATFTITAPPAETTTALTGSANPSTSGDSVTFTATVSAPEATGPVTFYSDGVSFGTRTLAGGLAMLSTASLADGVHAITAVYGGDAAHTGSTSAPLVQQVLARLPISESFKGSSAAGWTLLGTARLTGGNPDPPDGGWLQLTNAAGVQAGTALHDVPFSSSAGVAITFTYATGGDSEGDGFSCYLIDGSTPTPTAGATGGPLGYSAGLTSCGGAIASPGVTGGYVGIGFDEGGDFSSCGAGPGGPGRAPGSIALRGSGSGSTATGFRYLAGTAIGLPPFSQSLDTAGRAGARPARISLVRGRMTVEVDFGSGYEKVIDGFDLSSATGQAPLPATFKLGFSGSTSAFDDVHEIRDLTVRLPARLEVSHAVAPSPVSVGEAVTYTVTVTNDDLNDVNGAVFSDVIPAGISGVTWTAATAGGAVAVNASGSGNSISETVHLPRSSSVTYTITGIATAAVAGTAVTSAAGVTPPPAVANLGGGTASATFNVRDMDPVALTLGVSAVSVGYGTPVDLTAFVTALLPGAGVPAGAVAFMDGPATLLAAELDRDGSCTATALLGAGLHSITAVYGGHAPFAGGTSDPITVMVGQTTPAVSLATPSSAVFGQPVTFTADVAGPAGVPAPGGTVTFTDGARHLATVPLDGGSASLTTALTLGPHDVRATYGGDPNYTSSSCTSGAFSVGQGTTTLASGSSSPTSYGEAAVLNAVVSVTAPAAGVPTGTVTFFEGTTPIAGPVRLSGRLATASVPGLAVGAHLVNAVYSGDESFAGSSSGLSHTVSMAGTATVLNLTPASPAYGEAIALTAAVTGPGGTPSGAVTFTLDGAALATVALDAKGTATYFSYASTQVGAHTFTATYGGDARYAASTTGVVLRTVVKGGSELSLDATPMPSAFGSAVSFTAVVTSAGLSAGTPRGEVTFLDGGAPLGTVALDGAGVARFTTSTLPVALHSISASYGGDASFNGAASRALVEEVTRAAPTANLSISPAGVSGQTVTLTATVSGPGAVAGPSGAVTFRDGSAVLATVALDGGVARYTSASLAVGDHAITYSYPGDGNFLAATSVTKQLVVSKGSTTIALTAAPAATMYGAPVTLSAQVNPSAPATGLPTGTVTFSEGSTVLGAVSLDVGGQASLTTVGIALGTRLLTATYSGDASFGGATSAAVVVTVGQAIPSVELTVAPQQSVHGQPIGIEVRVAGLGPVPTGTVALVADGSLELGSPTLDASGKVAFTVNGLAVGSHTVTARYDGDANYLPGTSPEVAITVGQGVAALALTTSAQSVALGAPVTFTAAATAVAPATGVPSGSVAFKEGTTILGSGALDGSGRATFTTSALAIGAHTITAAYAGDDGFLPAESAGLKQAIGKGRTSTTLASSRNPSAVRRPVTFTAHVSVIAPSSGTPAGTVTFKDGEAALGAGTLDASGLATLTTRGLPKGTHAITAEYIGGEVFEGSSGRLSGGEVVQNSAPVAGSGTALAFDGVASSVSIDDPAGGLDLTTGTVEAWFAPDWHEPSEVGDRACLFALGDWTTIGYGLWLTAARDSFEMRSGARRRVVPVSLAAGEWHHVALVSDGSATALFLDGVQVASVEGALATSPRQPLFLGATPLPASGPGAPPQAGERFKGRLDEMRIWSIARTAEQLTGSARELLHGDEDGLVSLWRTDEGSGDELFDAGPAHIDGRLAGATWVASDAWKRRWTWEERPLEPFLTGYDPDGDPLTLTISTQAHSGAVPVDGQRAGYEPAPGFSGLDRFTYALSDGESTASFETEVEVRHVDACHADVDCAGSEVCLNGACVARSALSQSGGCASGGAADVGAMALLGLLLFAGRRRQA